MIMIILVFMVDIEEPRWFTEGMMFDAVEEGKEEAEEARGGN